MKYKLSESSSNGTRHIIMQGNSKGKSVVLCGTKANGIDPEEDFKGPYKYEHSNLCGRCKQIYLQGERHAIHRASARGFIP